MTSRLLRRPSGAQNGEIVSLTPDGRDWRYVGFRVLRIPDGGVQHEYTGDDEVLLVFIEGSASISSDRGSWESVGSRQTPFEGPPDALYLPPHSTYEIRAQGPVEVAVCAAAAREPYKNARRITVDARDGRTRGTGQAERRIFDILMEPDAACSLFVTEVLTPPGNWSSYPPHKHDIDNPPFESALEEIYYYRVQPSSGFAFQRVYTSDGELDETITACDRDLVLVPRGYHVCAAAAEYGLYYLNVLAGPKHVYHMSFDPAHEWIKEGWTW